MPTRPPEAMQALPAGAVLRDAEPGDGAALLTLGRTLLAETDHFIRSPPERARDAADMDRIVSRYAALPGWAMLTVWVDGLPVAEGVLSAGGLARTAHVGNLGIGVLKAYWGCGIGRALMASLEARADAAVLERLEFTVLAHNRRARDFYRRLGYLEEGRRNRSVRYEPATIGDPVRYGDEIVMAKWIGPASCISVKDPDSGE